MSSVIKNSLKELQCVRNRIIKEERSSNMVELKGVTGIFFQAEDGIRDWSGTGVQTCALPILDFIGTID